ncbi:hypothetical protein [Lysinibacillus fusiformis]|uniref:Uncharacterized protein n=1 Tax=Lysinibacillus fusiformis TaxID=28031 RepID=A0A1E4QYL5_9BACI|nr:hypothetical protein [Lysinibacillus fusiformis]ODV53269.1 hypothetical protein BG258_23485 [Lysinibacillus fusiformis]
MKIYNSFKITASMGELHELLNEFQELVNDAAVEITHERYSDLLAAHEYSTIARKLSIEHSSPLQNYLKGGFSILTGLYYKIWDAEKKNKKTGLSLPQFDFTCDVVIYPYQNQFLLKFFSSQRRYLDILRTNSRFQEYDYWDDTSKPPHISQEEWEHRSIVWNEVNQNITWAQSGYTRELYTGLKPLMPNKLKEIVNQRYSVNQRVEMFSKNILEHRLAEDTNWQDKKPFELIQYIKSPNAQIALDQIKVEIKKHLVEKYTIEMLSDN